MDTAQILLVVVISVLAVILFLLGIQVFFILREFMKTVRKVNKILDDAGTITESISEPVSQMSSLFAGLKTGMSLLSLFTKKKKHHQEENEDANE